MTWTTPKTWGTEVLTSADMNTYLSDNTQYLYDQLSSSTLPIYIYNRTSGVYSTTSGSYVDIDSTNLVSTITTTGGDVFITFTAVAQNTTTDSLEAYFALVADGVESDVIHFRIHPDERRENCSFTYTFTGLSAGSHTFRLRYKTNAGLTLQIRGDYVQWTVRELK